MPVRKLAANGKEVEIEGCDWGVEFPDGFTYGAQDEADARDVLRIAPEGSRLVAREVWVTAWAEAAE
jgi:hypothetical protein